MSDVKAALGAMPHVVWPRSSLADWAGIVVEGSLGLEGREVWGTFGALGVIFETRAMGSTAISSCCRARRSDPNRGPAASRCSAILCRL
jgi:hypothetical protein